MAEVSSGRGCACGFFPVLENAAEFGGGYCGVVVVPAPLAGKTKKVIGYIVESRRRLVGSVENLLSKVGHSVMLEMIAERGNCEGSPLSLREVLFVKI